MSFPTKEVHQTLGIIRGSIDDEVIILGNHRDSWGLGPVTLAVVRQH
jgi:hypothetical protein